MNIPFKSKENISPYGPGQDPQSMANTIANQNVIINQLNATITEQAATIARLEDTIKLLQETIAKLNKKVEELTNEKKPRSEYYSDSSNSPSLMKT